MVGLNICLNISSFTFCLLSSSSHGSWPPGSDWPAWPPWPWSPVTLILSVPVTIPCLSHWDPRAGGIITDSEDGVLKNQTCLLLLLLLQLLLSLLEFTGWIWTYSIMISKEKHYSNNYTNWNDYPSVYSTLKCPVHCTAYTVIRNL